MTQNLISNLLSDVWGDLHQPALLWQVVALVICLASGWLLARLFRGRFTGSTGSDMQKRFVWRGWAGAGSWLLDNRPRERTLKYIV